MKKSIIITKSIIDNTSIFVYYWDKLIFRSDYMHIQTIKRRDVSLASRLLLECLLEDFNLNPSVAKKHIDILEYKSKDHDFDETSHLLGAYEDGVLAGFLCGSSVEEDKSLLVVDYIFVSPQFRGSNISYKLILHFFDSYYYKANSRVQFRNLEESPGVSFYEKLCPKQQNLINDENHSVKSAIAVYSCNIKELIDLISKSFHSSMNNCPYCGFPLTPGKITSYSNSSRHYMWKPDKPMDSSLSPFQKIKKAIFSPSDTEVISDSLEMKGYKCERCCKIIIDIIQTQQDDEF